MKKYRILKLTGLAILTMAILVIISFLEVAVYSYLVNPGQSTEVYDAHAMSSAPYISAVFGFVIFFIVARHWKIKQYHDVLKLVLLFPLIYVLIDIIIITAAGVSWPDFILIFAIANGAKFLGSYLGYALTR